MSESVAHDPPEPAQALIAAMLAATSSLGELPRWFDHYPLQLTSPAARQVLWMLGRRVTRNPDAGFAVAERVPVSAVGSLWEAYQAAPTLRALHCACNGWATLLLDFVATHVVDDGPLVWVRLMPRDHTELDRAEQDFRAAMVVKTWRSLHADPVLAPAATHFTYARPSSVRAHALALGGGELRFSQKYLQLALSRAHADARLARADDETFARLALHFAAQARAPRPQSFAQRVEARITELLAQGPREPAVARALGLSVRSLRRRLNESGASFRSLVDRARQREVDLFLEVPEVPVSRVARLVGFTGDGALRNSMRRWGAVSPAARRRALAPAKK